MSEFMIDIETGALPHTIPPGMLIEVKEIAVVQFDDEGIHNRLQLFPAIGNGLCDGDTELWWIKQLLEKDGVPEWVQARLSNNVTPMSECLKQLTRFIGFEGRPRIWTKGAFDLPILEAHLAAERMPAVWKYHQHRDLRTVLKEAAVVVNYEDTTHNALEDCIAQVEQLREARSRMAGVRA